MSGEAGGGYFYPDSEDECYDDDPSCTWCGGEQYVECEDPLQCLASDCDQRTHRCPACNGTGLSKNQWVWLDMAPTRGLRETVPPDARCVFVEVPAGGGSVRCPDEPAYRVWVENCYPCATFFSFPMECVGHWACIRHGAEIRSGELDREDGDGSLVVERIRSL